MFQKVKVSHQSLKGEGHRERQHKDLILGSHS